MTAPSPYLAAEQADNPSDVSNWTRQPHLHASGLDHSQAVIGLVANKRTVVGRYHDVLDACPETTAQVDARLDREGVACDQRRRVPSTM